MIEPGRLVVAEIFEYPLERPMCYGFKSQLFIQNVSRFTHQKAIRLEH